MLKKHISLFLVISILMSLFTGISVFAKSEQNDFTCKNVILMIGSGMSRDHIDAAAYKSGQSLNILKMTSGGNLSTLNSKDKASDSAAAANALAAGIKTENFIIGYNNVNDLADSYTITEAAKNSGKKVGIITDKTLCDSTPAAFSANAVVKSDYSAITLSQIESGFDLFLGGGSNYLGRYTDEIAEEGYKYITSAQQLNRLDSESGKVIGAFSNYTFETGYNTPAISTMVEKATDILENENGFFLVAEGGRIDEASFDNNINDMVARLLEFDEAVGAAMEYVDANPDTLLIVTGDYEAGNLTLPVNPRATNITNSAFKSKLISTEKVPFFTYGKNATAFAGECENTDIPKMLAASMGIEGFSTDIAPMPEVSDYSISKLSAFSDWNFLNVRKNSKVKGVTLTTTTANNTAVTATATGSSLLISANARIGFELKVTAPVASPFVFVDNSGDDLSQYQGFVFRSAPLENSITVTMAKGDEFSASIELNDNMKNEYGEILVKCSDFTPAITPQDAIGLDTIIFASEGSSSKTTYMLYGFDAAKVDEGPNYAEVLAQTAIYDQKLYTADSYQALVTARDALKAAETRDDRYAAKLEVLDKIEELKPVVALRKDFDFINQSADNTTVTGAAYAMTESGLNVFCGSSPAEITFNNVSDFADDYDIIGITISSLTPNLTYIDDMKVTLAVTTPYGTVSDYVVRPIVYEGVYCFNISDINTDIESVSITFENHGIGAIFNVSGASVMTLPRVAMKAPAPNKPTSLEILRAVAGFADIEGNADINGDGIVDISDALAMLRYECKL